MIDFAKITKTLDGLDCRYLGQRTSGDQVINRFAVFNNTAELFCYYNEQGDRIEFSGSVGKWVVTPAGHQIIAPPKIVEVTRWVALQGSTFDGDGYHVACYLEAPPKDSFCLDVKQHTFRFEVPND